MFGIVNIQLKSPYKVLYMIKTQFVREGKSGAMPIWQFGIIGSSRSLSWRIHFPNGDIGWLFILPNISIIKLTKMKSSTTLLIITIHNECNYQTKSNQSSFTLFLSHLWVALPCFGTRSSIQYGDRQVPYGVEVASILSTYGRTH